MTPNAEIIGAIVAGLVVAGGIIGKQLGKVLNENAKNIERDLRLKSLEHRMKEVEEEQQFARRNNKSH